MAKTIYSLTHLTDEWHIHCYAEDADHIFAVKTHIASGDEAKKFALLEAMRHKPSEVIEIGASGIPVKLAAFE